MSLESPDNTLNVRNAVLKVSRVEMNTLSANTVTSDLTVSGNVQVGTANLFVDTVSSNVGIGTNAPMGTLDVKGVLNHTQVANVAQITSNSNVVMEYKLSTRDYEEVAEPRVAIDNTLSVGGYTVSASSTFNSGSTGTYGPWGAFNKLNDANGWSSDGHGSSTDTYSTSDGSQLLNVQHHTGSALGEWIQLDMPYGILLKSVDIHRASSHLAQLKKVFQRMFTCTDQQTIQRGHSLKILRLHPRHRTQLKSTTNQYRYRWNINISHWSRIMCMLAPLTFQRLVSVKSATTAPA